MPRWLRGGAGGQVVEVDIMEGGGGGGGSGVEDGGQVEDKREWRMSRKHLGAIELPLSVIETPLYLLSRQMPFLGRHDFLLCVSSILSGTITFLSLFLSFL
jgi:hypothetical protein